MKLFTIFLYVLDDFKSWISSVYFQIFILFFVLIFFHLFFRAHYMFLIQGHHIFKTFNWCAQSIFRQKLPICHCFNPKIVIFLSLFISGVAIGGGGGGDRPPRSARRAEKKVRGDPYEYFFLTKNDYFLQFFSQIFFKKSIFVLKNAIKHKFFFKNEKF